MILEYKYINNKSFPFFRNSSFILTSNFGLHQSIAQLTHHQHCTWPHLMHFQSEIVGFPWIITESDTFQKSSYPGYSHMALKQLFHFYHLGKETLAPGKTFQLGETLNDDLPFDCFYNWIFLLLGGQTGKIYYHHTVHKGTLNFSRDSCTDKYQTPSDSF